MFKWIRRIKKQFLYDKGRGINPKMLSVPTADLMKIFGNKKTIDEDIDAK